MKLHRLAIERLSGIDRPFALEELGDGLNVIVGPNGIGKSRLCAAVRALLWPDRDVGDGGLAASAVFEHQGARWHVSRDGSAYRWQRDGIDSEPPTLPGSRLDACFFLGLRDLLDNSDRAGQDLASEIRTQMSGGFDLDAVRLHFEGSILKRPGVKEGKALSAADTEIRVAGRSQEEAARQEQRLESLSARAAAAETAGRRLHHFETALSLLDLRDRQAQCEEALAELPQALENLDGKEIERLEGCDEELTQKRRQREDAEVRLAESRAGARETRLSESAYGATRAAWRERAEALVDLERRLETADDEAIVAREAAKQSRQPLGALAGSDAASDAESPPTVEDDFDLFAFLRESQQLATERVALSERLKLLSERAFSKENERRLELLKRGIDPLRAWLRAPDPEASHTGATLWPSRNAFLASGAALAVVGAVSLFIPQLLPFGIGIGSVGIGLVTAGLLSRLRTAPSEATDWRSVAEHQLPDGIEAPEAWSTKAVTEHLHRLEDEQAKLAAHELRARDRAVERAPLKESLESLDTKSADLESTSRELAERLGLKALRQDVEMVDLARALDASRHAHVAAREAEAKATAIEEDRRQRLEEISVFLVGLGEAEATDAASARAGIQSLKDRNRIWAQATESESREQKTLDRLAPEIEKLEADRCEIFRLAGASVDDRAELERVLNDLGRYNELKGQESELATRIRGAESDLDKAGEGALAARDRSRLEEERATLTTEAEHRQGLSEEIGGIRERAKSLREGHELEDAIAKRSGALSALHDRRDEVLAAAAGIFLVEGVRREHETNQMPRVLERARDRFAAFTHQRYELKVSSGGGGSFVAVDSRSQEGLTLDKLSDGTRAQLILAARLAFAEEAEQGADLPIFLDEALDHSDPERFHAIAGSLARMVLDEGRQVFYLSNDPTDVDRFRAAFDEEGCDRLKTLDLGKIRGEAGGVDGPEALRVAPLPSVPSPEGMGAEAYGAMLGVAAFDPSRDAFSQHLFYVLRDDLSLLHELLQARIETVGQCRNLLRGSSAFSKRVVGSGAGAQLVERIELLKTFVDAWREGRARTVGRLDLEASGAVTDTYLEAVVEAAAKLDGDADRLLAALRERKSPGLIGYRTKAADELERFFAEHGHVDDKPRLDEGAIVERAIATPAANLLSPKAAAEFVHQWWALGERS